MPKYTLPGLALICASVPSWSAVVNDTANLVALNSVVVTATRIEQLTDAVLAPVTVLNRADIERTQGKDVVELLQHAPGVDVIRTGGKGSAASLYIRGTNDDHALFLIDGQRIASATLGTTNFQLIDPEQIERIEIVRGPRSSLYGSDAVGGVVQILTRRGSAEPNAYIKAGYGNKQSSQVAAGGSGSAGDFHFSGNASHYYTEGISHLNSSDAPNNDRDLYRNSSANVRLGYDFNERIGIDLSHFYTESKSEFDSVFVPSDQPHAENWIQSTRLALTASPFEFWNITGTIGRSIDDFDTFNDADADATDRTGFRTTRSSASWQNDFNFNDSNTVTAGVDYHKDIVDASSRFETLNDQPVKSRDHEGYFAQYLGTFWAFDFQAGMRHDRTEDFSNENTGNIALGINLPAAQKLIFSYGTAFKAPTFNDLYWPVDLYSFGNPNLEAETSRNYEIEWRAQFMQIHTSLNIFRNDIRNLIDWAPVDASDPRSPYTPSNVSDAKIQGAEFIANTTILDWSLNAALTYTDARDDATDNQLVNRARRRFMLDADRDFDRWSIGASWRVRDYRYADVANAQRLGGYGLLDLRGSYNFTRALQTQLKLSNIFDKNYEERKGYNVDRFGIFATVTYRL